MSTSTPDPLEPLVQQWLQSDDPDPLLEQLCAAHPEHADALRSRLAYLAPTIGSGAGARAPAGDPDAPKQVGPYRILDTLGEGGMGTVFLAEQKEPVQRRVALKLIKLGMDTKAVVQRFEQERQALAVMDHEGIAKVHDVGTSDRGQPYFVMELVKGIPLDEYCERNRLSLPKRLELMRQVCAAVQHAHQKGVIHRDLKPGNVLVSDLDGRLQIKIIDFGLAKAMGQKLIQESLFTELGIVMGTPEYMAPEQADPSNLDIDTRADVYSLGVMLYQLLVGELPFSGKELRAAGILGMQKLLREVDPPRPSTKLTTVAEQSSEVAAQLRITPSALKKALKGDLDWVVVKALEKDRSRRYESANALAADLQRYLDHEPLEAGPPSAAYRLQKLVRRNRGKVAAAALVMSALLLGGVGTYVQWQRAEEQRARAEEQRAGAEEQRARAEKEAAANLGLANENERIAAEKTKLAESYRTAKEAAVAALGERDAALEAEKARSAELEAVAQFQQDQFAEIDADLMGLRLRDALRDLVAKRCEARGLEAAATEAAMAAHDDRMRGVDFTGLALGSLDQNFFVPGLRVLDAKFADQPLLQARLRQTIATTLQELGRLELALEPQQQAVEVRRRVLGGGDAVTLASTCNLGTLLVQRGEFSVAEPLYREALEVSRRVLGEEDPQTLALAGSLATLLLHRGRLSQAEPLLRETLDVRRRVLGDEHPDTLRLMNNLGGLLHSQGQLSEAEPLLREVLAASRRVLGDEHPDTLESVNNLGSCLHAQGKLPEAEPLLRDGLGVSRRVLGGEHPQTLRLMNNLGLLLGDRSKPDEAEPLYREALEVRRRMLGDEHPATLTSMNNLGLLLQAQGKLPEAESLFRVALEVRRRVLGDDHSNTLTSVNNLGTLYVAQGKLSKAESVFREVLAGSRRALGEEHRDTLLRVGNLGVLLRKQGKLREAEPLLRDGLEVSRRVLGGEDPRTLYLMKYLGYVLKDQGKLSEAEPLYREALEVCRRMLGNENPKTLKSLNALGVCLDEQGKTSDAELVYREALEAGRRVLGDDHPSTLSYLNNLVLCLYVQGNLSEAMPLMRECVAGRRRAMGDQHPLTIRNARDCCILLQKLGRSADARAFLTEFLETTELEADHAHVIELKQLLASLPGK